MTDVRVDDVAALGRADFGPTVSGSVAPCRAACPVGTDAAAYVALIAEGRLAEAYDVARAHNPFASICGRVCSAPCESACRRGIVDAPISIRALKRVLAEHHGPEAAHGSRWRRAVGEVPPASKPSVGIIGAGPAGLAAAHDLRIAGHAVTVYESASEAGGMLRYGIPTFRLPREILAAEIAAMVDLGITLRLSCVIGRDVTFTQLLNTHATVLIAVGCQQGRDLHAPGANLPGVERAVDFLRAENERLANRGESDSALAEGPAVVIGGGSVAFDAARSAWRSRRPTAYDGQAGLDAARMARRGGDRVVTMIAPEERAAMPVPEEELHEAVAEGVALYPAHGVVRIVGTERVSGVEIAPVRALRREEGRVVPELDLERLQLIPATTVVLAIGQRSNTDFLADTPTVTRTPWGGVTVDAELHSEDPRVWAAGDVATGPRDLIDAVAAGQRAAASMRRWMQRAHPVEVGTAATETAAMAANMPSVPGSPPLEHDTRFWSGYDVLPRTALPVLDTTRRDARAEVEQAWDVPTARREAARCLRCDEHMQFAVDRCIVCALCVDVCPQTSLALLPAPPGGLALVFDDDTCIRCGLCVARCPTHALEFALAPAMSQSGLPFSRSPEVPHA